MQDSQIALRHAKQFKTKKTVDSGVMLGGVNICTIANGTKYPSFFTVENVIVIKILMVTQYVKREVSSSKIITYKIDRMKIMLLDHKCSAKTLGVNSLRSK